MAAAIQAQITVLDDIGERITLHQPARRIISLAPHVTELLYAAGAGNYIVATVEYSDFPEAARALPRIGNSNALDLERIVSLHPDLVVGWHSGNPDGVAKRLRALGLTVFMSEPGTLEDIAENIQKLGWLARTEDIAHLEAVSFREELKKLQSHYHGRTRIRVFYQITYTPIFTVNAQHMISRVLDMCGADNVFSGLTPVAPQVSVEAVLQANPQAIIGAHYEQGVPDWLQAWQRWPAMDAVRYRNIFYLHPDIIARHTPRVLLGAAKICGFLDEARSRLPISDRRN